MEPHYYIIEDIQGDYAQLQSLDDPTQERFPVAMALLPMGVDIGAKVYGMMGCFAIVTE